MKILHQQRIKEFNLKRILSMIIAEQGISRAKIAKLAKLSKTTVSSLVDVLISQGYVLDDGIKESNKQGRKPNQLVINKEIIRTATISWQPDYVEGIMVPLDSQHSEQEYIKVNVKNNDYVSATAELYQMLLNSESTPKKILSLCIILPASIAKDQRILTTVLSIKPSDDIIANLRAKIPNVPLAIFNDTACISYAENSMAGKVNDSYVYINMAKGVGAVLFANGELLRKADGMTTQFGHFSIDKDGEVCECGKRGCIENLLGEKVIGKLGEEFGIPYEEKLTYLSLGRRADLGDPKAQLVIENMAKNLATAIGNMITIYNVTEIVIGGRGPRLGNYFIEKLSESIKEGGFKRFTDELIVVYSTFSLDTKTEFAGAAQYYFDRHHFFLDDNENEIFIG